MKADVDISLVHDGKKWVAKGGAFSASGCTLSELDDDVGRALRERGEFKNLPSVTVFMAFDFSTIPTWLRQYASHYFNRCVTIDMRPGDKGPGCT